jgi:hypothetical protein
MTQEIVTYSSNEIEQVKDLEQRIVDFLPGAKDVPHDVRMAMAQISIAHGLDPWLKEVWPIPVKKNGQIVGWELMIGISGWRNAAHRSNEYWGRRFERVSDEERKWLAAGPNDLVVRCIVMRRKTGQQPAEFDGYGVASPTEFSKMNKFQLARLRAERDAMKAAFPISSPMGVTLTAVDDDGQAINGDHGPSWDVVKSETLSDEQLQERLEKNKKALGRDDGSIVPSSEPDTLDELTQTIGRDAITNAPAPEQTDRKTYRMAKINFDGMTPDQWHALADKFCIDNPNWQKNGKPDLNNVLASAGNAGYETITADNIADVFDAIVGLHAQKTQP